MRRARLLDPAALPTAAAALLATAATAEFQFGAAWFAALAEAALAAPAHAGFLAAEADGRLLALLPVCRHGGRFAALTAPYTSIFRPLAGAAAAPAELTAAGRAFAAATRGGGVLRLDALEAEWPGLAPLLAGFAAGGMAALRFAHFGNWHLPVAGLDWAAYLSARPGALRSTLRRKERAGFDFSLIVGGAGLADGIAAYEAVHARSWKPTEPFPRFAATLMRHAAAAGVLRLGLLHRDGVPLAAQIWTLAGGTATVHKLAHDRAAEAASPGSLLTARMIRHLLDQERVAALDFGRGDDAYKAAWTGQRRQRIGVLLCAPWHPAGIAAIARHAAGRFAARLGPAKGGQWTHT